MGTDPKLAAALKSMTDAGEFDGVITAAQAAQLTQQTGLTLAQLMLALVQFAQAYAQPTISNFKVGAVALGSTTGNLYYGANMEFAGQALSFTLHAEQSATANAWLHGEQGVAQLAIGAAPCGYCRQFLYELSTADQLEVLLPDTAPAPLTAMLPDAFGPHDLGVESALMTPDTHPLTVSAPLDELGEAALAAAETSYAPYTQGYAGVAVQTGDGLVFPGRYAENAAYNPSLSPLECALSMVNLSGRMTSTVTAAALVEVPGPADQRAATEAVLSTLGDVPLAVYAATG